MTADVFHGWGVGQWVFLAFCVASLLTACVLGWRQASDADPLPENDLDVRRRHNAEQAKSAALLAKLRDAERRGA